jgi:hypothetical protein
MVCLDEQNPRLAPGCSRSALLHIDPSHGRVFNAKRNQLGSIIKENKERS